MPLSPEQLIQQLESIEKFRFFKANPKSTMLFLPRNETGHPESMLIVKDEKASLKVYTIARNYKKDPRRGEEIVVGGGGQGVVFLGKCLQTNQFVAIKRLQHSGEFHLEAYRIAIDLQQKINSVIPVYAAGLAFDTKDLYAVMKLGKCDLESIEKVPLSITEKEYILEQMTRFSIALAENHYYFSDFKSRNVLLSHDNKIQVCDLEGFFHYSQELKSQVNYSYIIHIFDWLHYGLIPRNKYDFTQDVLRRAALASIVSQLDCEFKELFSSQISAQDRKSSDELVFKAKKVIHKALIDADSLINHVTTSSLKPSVVNEVENYSVKHEFYAYIDLILNQLQMALFNNDHKKIKEIVTQARQKLNSSECDQLFAQEERNALKRELDEEIIKFVQDQQLPKMVHNKDFDWLTLLDELHIQINNPESIIQTEASFIIESIDVAHDEDFIIKFLNLLGKSGSMPTTIINILVNKAIEMEKYEVIEYLFSKADIDSSYISLLKTYIEANNPVLVELLMKHNKGHSLSALLQTAIDKRLNDKIISSLIFSMNAEDLASFYKASDTNYMQNIRATKAVLSSYIATASTAPNLLDDKVNLVEKLVHDFNLKEFLPYQRFINEQTRLQYALFLANYLKHNIPPKDFGAYQSFKATLQSCFTRLYRSLEDTKTEVKRNKTLYDDESVEKLLEQITSEKELLDFHQKKNHFQTIIALKRECKKYLLHLENSEIRYASPHNVQAIKEKKDIVKQMLGILKIDAEPRASLEQFKDIFETKRALLEVRRNPYTNIFCQGIYTILEKLGIQIGITGVTVTQCMATIFFKHQAKEPISIPKQSPSFN